MSQQMSSPPSLHLLQISLFSLFPLVCSSSYFISSDWLLRLLADLTDLAVPSPLLKPSMFFLLLELMILLFFFFLELELFSWLSTMLFSFSPTATRW